MTHQILKDQFLMRFKDFLLIATALIGIWAFFAGYVSKSYGNQEKLNQITKDAETHMKKYEPIVDSHEKSIIILQEQNKMIISYLDKIERSVRK